MMKTLKTSVLADGFWRLKAPRWHMGALWVSDTRAGKVFRIDLDGKVTVVADVPSRPFGLGFLPDGELLVAETLGNRLLAFKIEADGTLLHRKVFANFERMSPLGICADSEGAVWTAAARQPLFVRVMQGGRVTHRVHVPGRHAVSCQLGGRDGRTLFCLTVAANLGEYPDRQQTARVETALVDVPGAATSIRFAEIGSH